MLHIIRSNVLITALLFLVASSFSLYAESNNPSPCTDPWSCDYPPAISGTIDGPDTPCHDSLTTYAIKESSFDGQRSRCGLTEPVHASPIAWSWALSGPEIDSGIGNSFEHTFKQAGTYTITFTGRASTEGPPCPAPDNAVATKMVTISGDIGTATLTDASGCPGSSAVLSYTITNTGSCTATYSWLAYALEGDPQVTLAPITGSATLAPGASTTGTITALIADASPRGIKSIHMDVDTSVTRGIANPIGHVIVPVPSYHASLTSVTVCRGDDKSMPFTISVGGCSDEQQVTYVISQTGGNLAVGIAPQSGTATISPGHPFNGTTLITCPSNQLLGTATLTIKVSTSADGQVAQATGTATLEGPSFDGRVHDASGCRGDSIDNLVEITNNGDCDEVIDWKVEKIAGALNLDVSGNHEAGVPIKAHETLKRQIAVIIAPDLAAGDATLQLAVMVAGNVIFTSGAGENGKISDNAAPNQGVAEGPQHIYVPLSTNRQPRAAVDLSIIHRIVTINTPRARDLHGVLALRLASGDKSIVRLGANGTPGEYQLGTQLPIVEPGHEGCGVHDWHQGQQDFSIEGLKVGDVTVEAIVTPDVEFPEGQGRATKTATIIISVFNLDLAIDSLNTHLFAPPTRSTSEDDAEDRSGPGFPGKFILTSIGDSDGDGIPDFADGYDFGPQASDSSSDAGAKLTPTVIEIQGGDSIDPDAAEITISYDASDPIGVTVTGSAPYYSYHPAPGAMRIWTKDASQHRSSKSPAAGGDYIAPGTYTMRQLGLVAGKPTTWFVEGVAPSRAQADARITASVAMPAVVSAVQTGPPSAQAIAEAAAHHITLQPAAPAAAGVVTSDDAVRCSLVQYSTLNEPDGGSLESGGAINFSEAAPVVDVQQAEVRVPPVQIGSTISGTLVFSATVRSNFCDTVPGSDGTIDSLEIYQNEESEPLATIALASNKSVSTDLTHPYPYRGTVHATVRLPGVVPGTNQYRILAREKVSGRSGSYIFSVKVSTTDPVIVTAVSAVTSSRPTTRAAAALPPPADPTWQVTEQKVLYQRTSESNHPMVIRIEGVFDADQARKFGLRWEDGNSSKFTRYADGLFYLASRYDSTKPAVLFARPHHDEKTEGLGSDAAAAVTFTGGFLVGIYDCGVGFIEGIHGLYTGAKTFLGSGAEGISWLIIYSFDPDSGEEFFQNNREDSLKVEEALRITADMVEAVGDILDKLQTDKTDAIVAVLSGNEKTLNRLSDEYRIYMIYGVEVFDAILDEAAKKSPYEKGKVTGRFLCEVASLFVGVGELKALTKLDFLVKIKEAGILAKFISNVAVLKRIDELIVALRYAKMCFPAGTMVATPSGPQPIEGVRPGMSVWTRNVVDGGLEAMPVVACEITHPSIFIALRVASGGSRPEEIVVTPGHPFWCVDEGAWVAAGDVVPGHHVLGLNGKSWVVSSVLPHPSEAGEKAFNLLVHSNHNYFVGGGQILVHNGIGSLCQDGTNLLRQLWSNKKDADKIIDVVSQFFVKQVGSGKVNNSTLGGLMEEAASISSGIIRQDNEVKVLFDGEQNSSWLVSKLEKALKSNGATPEDARTLAEVRAAIALRKKNRSVRWRDDAKRQKTGLKTSDFFVDGETKYDVYSPNDSVNRQSIINTFMVKAGELGSDGLSQTNRIIVDLTRQGPGSPHNTDAVAYWQDLMTAANEGRPLDQQVQEVLLLRDDNIVQIVPKP